jgi:hypothetical protein
MARLATATQGTIVRRLELMMLDHKELVSGWIFEAMLGLLAVGMGLAAWFTATTALVLYAVPELSSVAHLAIVASIHAAAAAAVVACVVRVKSRSGATRSTGRAATAGASTSAREPDDFHVQ